jgi:hypothetical protein
VAAGVLLTRAAARDAATPERRKTAARRATALARPIHRLITIQERDREPYPLSHFASNSMYLHELAKAPNTVVTDLVFTVKKISIAFQLSS